MAESKNVSSSIKRAMRVIKIMKGYAITGLSNGEIAKTLQESPANISRVLNALIEEGMAQKLSTGRYTLGMQLLQIAYAFSNEMDNMQGRIIDLKQRVDNNLLY